MVTEAVQSTKVMLIAHICIFYFVVGWPLGLNPAANSWKWMSDSVRDFAEAVDESMKAD